MKIQFGSGSNRLPGWHNCDKETDIRRPLPFATASADFVFAEHVIEHVTAPEAVAFLVQCHRILKPTGWLRLAFPDPVRVAQLVDDASPQALVALQEMLEALRAKGKPAARLSDLYRALICDHGHLACWCEDTMHAALAAAGFGRVIHQTYGESVHPELRNIDGHHKVTSLNRAILQTTVLEACHR